MAETVLATGNEKQIWIDKFFEEYVRTSRFLPYMGAGYNMPIVTKYELEQEAGKTINIPLLTRLKAQGVYNNGILEGKEEAMGNYNMPISIQWIRNAVTVPKSTQYKTEINLLNAARPLLRTWSAENLRDWIIKVGMSSAWASGANYPMVQILDDDGNVVRAAADEGQKDTWLGNNLDRILFGNALANTSGTDHSASLANITTAMKMSTGIAMLAKELAVLANPHIRPFQVEDSEAREYFVMFLGQRAMRDLQNDTAMIAANRDARAREAMGMDRNPLFQDGDLIYDGIIFRCVPEITTILTTSSAFATASSTGTPIEPCFLCGAQAAAIAWGEQPTPVTDLLPDYRFRPGVAIQELRGVEKLVFNNVQQGMVTVYVAGSASA
jgi:N4-gp56 family major capsid protein